MELIEQAKRLEAAGVFSMVLECVPEEVAKEVTAAVSVRAIYTYLYSVAVVCCSILLECVLEQMAKMVMAAGLVMAIEM